MEFETLDKQQGDESQFSSSSKGNARVIMQAMGIMDEMPTAMKGSQNDKTKGKDTMYSSTTKKLEKNHMKLLRRGLSQGKKKKSVHIKRRRRFKI